MNQSNYKKNYPEWHYVNPNVTFKVSPDKESPMDEAGNFQDNIRSLSVFGGNFTDIKGDAYHYHIRGNFHNHELEPGRGE